MMNVGQQPEVVREVALESARENIGLNLICMEGLSTNALRIAQWKRDKCALLAQQVNLEIVDLFVADEQMKKRNTIKEVNAGRYYGSGIDPDISLAQSRLQDSDFYSTSSLPESNVRINGRHSNGAPTWNPFQGRNSGTNAGSHSNVRRMNFQ